MKEKVLIMGASGLGKHVLYSLPVNKYEVIGFVDANYDIIPNKNPYGYPLYKMEQLKDLIFDKIVLPYQNHAKRMRQELLDIYIYITG